MVCVKPFRRLHPPVARRAVVACACVSVLLAACGSSDESTSRDTAAQVESTTVDTVGEAATGTSPDSVTGTSSDAAPGGDAQGIQENRPVSVTGTPLVDFENTVGDPAIGVAAPVVSGASFDGTPITIGGPTDNPTLVVFLAHWCPHCNDEVPELISLADSGGLPEGLDVIGVSTAVSPGAPNYPPSEWIVDKGWPWPTMADDADTTALVAMGGTGFPFAVVLDTDGTVLARRSGEAKAADTKVFLEDALAGA